MQSILRKALLEQEAVEIIYLSKDNITSQRVVTIYNMNDVEVKGYCHLRRSVRTFRLENILAVYPYRFKISMKELYA